MLRPETRQGLTVLFSARVRLPWENRSKERKDFIFFIFFSPLPAPPPHSQAQMGGVEQTFKLMIETPSKGNCEH